MTVSPTMAFSRKMLGYGSDVCVLLRVDIGGTQLRNQFRLIAEGARGNRSVVRDIQHRSQVHIKTEQTKLSSLYLAGFLGQLRRTRSAE